MSRRPSPAALLRPSAPRWDRLGGLALAATLVLGAPWMGPSEARADDDAEESEAPAAPPAGVLDGMALDDARGLPGLVVFELTRDDACEDDEAADSDPWDGAALKTWLGEHDAYARVIDRRSEPGYVRKLVDGGRETLPMRIAYVDGAEVDRMCGCAADEALVAWMEGLLEGRTLADTARQALGDPTAEDVELDVLAELDVVRLHYCADRIETAYDTLESLWTLIPDKAPEQRLNRLTRIPHDMAVLARRSEAVTARIESLRDGLSEAKDLDYDALDAWVALNRVLLDDDRTLAWYDANEGDPSMAPYLAHQGPNLFYMLAERDRWADAGALIGDTDRWLARWKELPGGLEQAVWGFAALAAAERHKDAKKLGKGILDVSGPETACAMASKVVAVGAAHPSQKAAVKSCEDEAVLQAWDEAR